MKKCIVLVAIAALALTSCGTTRNVTYASAPAPSYTPAPAQEQSSLGKKREKSSAQLYAEDPNATTLRAYASYRGLPSQPVARLAATQARGELAQSIATLVKTAIDMYSNSYSKENLTNEGVDTNASAVNKAEEMTRSIAEELVRYAPAVITDEYDQPNGMVEAHVCVEMHPQRILEAVRGNDAYQKAVNEKEQAYVDMRSEQFEEKMQESFDNMKAEKSANAQ